MPSIAIIGAICLISFVITIFIVFKEMQRMDTPSVARSLRPTLLDRWHAHRNKKIVLTDEEIKEFFDHYNEGGKK
jgi:hypothetical protein